MDAERIKELSKLRDELETIHGKLECLAWTQREAFESRCEEWQESPAGMDADHRMQYMEQALADVEASLENLAEAVKLPPSNRGA
jgi:hypothetical protein